MKNSSRSQKKKWTFVDKKRDENTASNGMVCCCQQVPMSEMWKLQQVHEDARTMCRAEIFGKEFGDMEKAACGRGHDMARRTDMQGEVLSCCQNMLGLRTTENGTKTDELLQARASGHNRAWQKC